MTKPMIAVLFSASFALSACTGGGRPAPNSPFDTVGSTRFEPGVGCRGDRVLVGNRCEDLNNDFR